MIHNIIEDISSESVASLQNWSKPTKIIVKPPKTAETISLEIRMGISGMFFSLNEYATRFPTISENGTQDFSSFILTGDIIQ